MAVTTACVPSHRLVHQGNAFFEHCYAADSTEGLTDTQRERCWTAWLGHYTRFQPSHRIDYAMRRIEALQMGGALMEMQMDSEPAATAAGEDPVTSSNTLQAYATQEQVVPAGCSVTCQQFRAECQAHCTEDSLDPCVESCAADERVCLGGCY